MIDKSIKIWTPSMYEWLEPPGTPTEVIRIHQLCRGSVGTLDSQQSYREVKTLTITILNLEYADFVVFLAIFGHK